MKDFSDKIIIEVGGHDHWEDLRFYDNNNAGPIRNLFVAAGVTPKSGQLPAFNSFIVDENLIPRGLVMTSLDITSVYGQKSIPPLSTIPQHTLDFQKDYGLYDLTAASIKNMLFRFSDNFELLKNYLVDKVGYSTKPSDGLKLYQDWGLINSSLTSGLNFLC
jgi:hypothetical protein